MTTNGHPIVKVDKMSTQAYPSSEKKAFESTLKDAAANKTQPAPRAAAPTPVATTHAVAEKAEHGPRDTQHAHKTAAAQQQKPA